jgi:hypothetical protein
MKHDIRMGKAITECGPLGLVKLVTTCILGLAVLVGSGCRPSSGSSEAADEGKAGESFVPEKFTVIPKPPTVESVDEEKSFTHEFTRVRLCYPPNWTVESPEIQGGLANLHLYQRGISVMVFWGRTHSENQSERAMLAYDLSELRKIFDDNVGDPESIKVGDKFGHRINLFSSRGEVRYVFYVDAPRDLPKEESWARGKWAIKVYVTATDSKADLAGEVLHCLRWK